MHKFLLFLLLGAFACAKKDRPAKYPFLNNLTNGGTIFTGTIRVPEDHANPSGKQISIMYAILKARNPQAGGYPVIHLAGGPGGEALYDLNRWTAHPLRDEHDLIIFDQRGVGYSSKLPDPSVGLFQLQAQDLSMEEEYERVKDTLQQYKELCRKHNRNLGLYTTYQNAADVNALMQALGYEKYVLMGESYGTRLARMVMEKFPEKISHVVLDAPAMLEDDFLAMRLRNYSQVLEKLFAQCEQNAVCSETYPHLRDEYTQAILSLDEQPMEATIDGKPFFINPQDAIFLLRYQLYTSDAQTRVPAFIKALADRDTAYINNSQEFLVDVVNRGSVSMFLSVERHEAYIPHAGSLIDSLYHTLPNFPAQLGFFSSLHAALEDWHTESLAHTGDEFHTCTIPTLIFVNKYDPVTPPANGYAFAKTLPRADLYVLDAAGHGINSPCEVSVLMNFIRNPVEYDHGCLGQ